MSQQGSHTNSPVSRAQFLRKTAQVGAATASASLIAATPALAAPAAKRSAASSKTLTLWLPRGNYKTPNGFRTLVANFRHATGITVNVQEIPFPSYDSKSNTALAAGQGPDLLEVNSVTLGAFILRGYLQAIDTYLPGASVKQDQFYPGLLKHGLYGKKMWGLPIDTGTRCLFYNKKLLAQARIKPPTTHAEFEVAAKKLTDAKAGIYGYNYMGGEKWVWLYEALGMLTVQDQATIVTPNLKTCTLAQHPAVDSLELLVRLQAAGATPKGAVSDTTDQRAALFAAGRAAMTFFGFWEIPALRQLKMPPSEYGIVNLRGQTGSIGSTTGGWVMCIPTRIRLTLRGRAQGAIDRCWGAFCGG